MTLNQNYNADASDFNPSSDLCGFSNSDSTLMSPFSTDCKYGTEHVTVTLYNQTCSSELTINPYYASVSCGDEYSYPSYLMILLFIW